MALTRIVCPECGAALTSKTGFTPGRTANCPKCETPFTVEEPDDAAPGRATAAGDDDAEDRPRKKKRRRDDGDEVGWSYSRSWIRYAVLGVLVVVMLVLAYLLYEKKQREAKDAHAPRATPPVAVACYFTVPRSVSVPTRIVCPDCGAEVKSAAGFAPGRTVRCPTCDGYFTVGDSTGRDTAARASGAEENDHDRADDFPRARRSVAGSVLVGLLVAGAIAGVGWYGYQARVKEQQAQREAEERAQQETAARAAALRAEEAMRAAQAGGPPGLPGLLAGQPTPAEARRITDRLGGQLVGTWRGTTADGATREVEYRADGTYNDKVNGDQGLRNTGGTWKVVGLIGTRVLRVERSGGNPRVVRVTFEDGELVHDGDRPGESVVLRRQ